MNLPMSVVSLAPYVGVALSLIASLALFISLKSEIRRQRDLHAASLEGRKAEYLELWKDVQAIKQEVRILPLTIPQRCAGPEPATSKRAQILRMHQAGIAADQIAVALAVPLQEIELAIRANQIARGAAGLARRQST
jgi:hypothetical protein